MNLVNELFDIADRIDQLLSDADGFNKPMSLLMAELADYANDLRDQADTIAEQMAEEYGQ